MINNETAHCFKHSHCRVLDDNKLHLLHFHFNLEKSFKCVYKLFIFSHSGRVHTSHMNFLSSSVMLTVIFLKAVYFACKYFWIFFAILSPYLINFKGKFLFNTNSQCRQITVFCFFGLGRWSDPISSSTACKYCQCSSASCCSYSGR